MSNGVIEVIEKYYGLNIDEKYKDGLEVHIQNYIHKSNNIDKMPSEFYIEHNGKLVKGKVANILINDIMKLRHDYDTETFTFEGWENILIPCSQELTYCEDNRCIYNIDKEVGNYLTKHNMSAIFFDIVSNKIKFPTVNGELIKILPEYIKREKSISTKKYIATLGKDLDIDDPFFALHYIEKMHYTPKSRSISSIHIALQNTTEYKGIVFEDLKYRYEHGMDMDEAIKLGTYEARKYGFIGNNNENVTAYLRYLVSQEDNNGQ